jgi:hypothetical protein
MRVNKVTVLMGEKNTGKSYYTVRSLIPFYKKRFPEKGILIVGMTEHPAYSFAPPITPEMIPYWKGNGIYRCFSPLCEDVMANFAADNVRNALLIFEDATAYIPAKIQKGTKHFLIDCKQKNVDLVLQFHGFMECPPSIWRTWCDILVLFHSDDPNSRKKELRCYERDN